MPYAAAECPVGDLALPLTVPFATLMVLVSSRWENFTSVATQPGACHNTAVLCTQPTPLSEAICTSIGAV